MLLDGLFYQKNNYLIKQNYITDGMNVCPDCYRTFTRKSSLKYHLDKKVCQGRELPVVSPSVNNETLRLMIEYKEREIELAKLHLAIKSHRETELETALSVSRRVDRSDQHQADNSVIKEKVKTTVSTDNPRDQSVATRESESSRAMSTAPNVVCLNNFGKEKCDGLDSPLIISLYKKYGENAFKILSSDILRLLHFNPSTPENMNIKCGSGNGRSDENILVYHDDEWNDIRYDLVVHEYVKGNLDRISKLVDQQLFEKIEASTLNNLEAMYTDFLITLTNSSSLPLLG